MNLNNYILHNSLLFYMPQKPYTEMRNSLLRQIITTILALAFIVSLAVVIDAQTRTNNNSTVFISVEPPHNNTSVDKTTVKAPIKKVAIPKETPEEVSVIVNDSENATETPDNTTIGGSTLSPEYIAKDNNWTANHTEVDNSSVQFDTSLGENEFIVNDEGNVSLGSEWIGKKVKVEEVAKSSSHILQLSQVPQSFS